MENKPSIEDVIKGLQMQINELDELKKDCDKMRKDCEETDEEIPGASK
ncbi:MAG: hypothetical protein GY699_08395 [Desulfobacteraceae bacterium]|nr:hypothetical protein [Desulfobacteraceae bacterium]